MRGNAPENRPSNQSLMNLVDHHHNKKTVGLRGRPFKHLSDSLRGHRVATEIRIEARTENTADHTKDTEIHSGLHCNVSFSWIGSLQDDGAVALLVSLDGCILAQPRGDNVIVLRILARVDHHKVTFRDAATDHTVALHLEEEHMFRRVKAATECD